MQQLYLTGSHASKIALQLFHALNIRPVGFRLAPFEVGGNVRGEAVDLLLPPAAPSYNGVPCRIHLSPSRTAVVITALEEAAQKKGRHAAVSFNRPQAVLYVTFPTELPGEATEEEADEGNSIEPNA